MNWGKRIAFVYIVFVLIIMTMVVLALNQKIDLVADNYYDQELKYQDKINGNNNFNQLKDSISIAKSNSNELIIKFPLSLISNFSNGTIQFVKQSDNRNDFKTEIKINELNQQIIQHNFQKGIYKVSFDWSMNNKLYYYEQDLVF